MALPTPAGMSASFALCTAIWNGLVVPIEGGTHALSGSLEAWMGSQYPKWIAAYILVMMLISAWNKDQDAIMRMMRLGFLASIIYAICSRATVFDYYITGLAHGTVASIASAMANAFGGGGQAVTAGTFDTIGTRAFAVGSKVFAVIPWYSFKGLALAIPVCIYWLASLIAVATMFTLWMVSYVSTDIILSFCPIFVGLYSIPFMRPTALGAFRVVLAGMLTQIMLVGALVLFLKVLQVLLGSVVGMTGDLGGAAANTANTPVAGEGDIAGAIYTLCFSAAAVGVFLYVIWDIIKIARAIAGAPSSYVPDWRALSSAAGSVGGTVGGAMVAVSPIGETSAAANENASGGRQYAFQRQAASANHFGL